MKKMFSLLLTAMLGAALLTGCGGGSQEAEEVAGSSAESIALEESKACELEDGTYQVNFDTDSGMFHVNEAMDGKGILTVKEGGMVVHISLVSKKIVNLYPGLAEDAEKDGAVLLEPTVDTVTYSDGMSEEVFGFDVPVPYLDEEFDLALVGEKGTWYDHKVSVSDPEPYEGADEEDTQEKEASESEVVAGEAKTVEEMELADGTYQIPVALEGGSGKASVESPATLKVENGVCTAVITWSSPYYDFMVVDGTEYQPVNTEGNSVFEIPVGIFGEAMEVQADTVAMSKPHLIDYKLTFSAEVE